MKLLCYLSSSEELPAPGHEQTMAFTTSVSLNSLGGMPPPAGQAATFSYRLLSPKRYFAIGGLFVLKRVFYFVVLLVLPNWGTILVN